MRTISSQIGHNSGPQPEARLFEDDVESPQGSLSHMRKVADEVVSMRASRPGNGREKAIAELTREFRFGTWLERLLIPSREPTIHWHYVNRLIRALEAECIAQEKRIAEHRTIARRHDQTRDLVVSLGTERPGGLPSETRKTAPA